MREFASRGRGRAGRYGSPRDGEKPERACQRPGQTHRDGNEADMVRHVSDELLSVSGGVEHDKLGFRQGTKTDRKVAGLGVRGAFGGLLTGTTFVTNSLRMMTCRPEVTVCPLPGVSSEVKWPTELVRRLINGADHISQRHLGIGPMIARLKHPRRCNSLSPSSV